MNRAEMKEVTQALTKEDQVILSIMAIHSSLAQLRDLLGSQIGVTAPQWTILALLENLNAGRGASVKDVAALMSVDPSFISAQSKLLQREKLIRRDPSTSDRRLVMLSLTSEGRERMKPAWRNRDRLRAFMQLEKRQGAVDELVKTLDAVQARLSKAVFLASIGE
jgi:DNA-binding MarR family transcriptional regulator